MLQSFNVGKQAVPVRRCTPNLESTHDRIIKISTITCAEEDRNDYRGTKSGIRFNIERNDKRKRRNTEKPHQHTFTGSTALEKNLRFQALVRRKTDVPIKQGPGEILGTILTWVFNNK